MTLVEEAKARGDVVVVSIFVNPMQFEIPNRSFLPGYIPFSNYSFLFVISDQILPARIVCLLILIIN
ncbi:hypothetical protein A8A01_12840 [Ewingella americana]|nr:hypothetical protein A8A01_12840 [Ewingella americana]